MANRARATVVGVLMMGTMLLGAPRSEAGGEVPPLTADQQQKLQKIRAMFVPGADSRGYHTEKVEESCGAKIPFEVHPSTVAYDNPSKSWDRSNVPGVCDGVAEVVVSQCGDKDADPVVKEMIRSSVKKIACKSTDKADQVDPYKLEKWSLENGTLTYTFLANRGGDSMESGMKFLQKNVKNASGLSVGGQLLKRKMYDDLSPKKESLFKLLKDECGIDNLSVTVDDKLAEHYAQHLGDAPTAGCGAGLQSVYNFCGRTNEFTEEFSNANAVKATFKKHFKGISCVYSDEESIAIKPGGILELGGKADAPRPKWNGHLQTSIHDYYMNWLNANYASLSQPATSTSASTNSASTGRSAAPTAKPSAKPTVRLKKKP